MHLRAFFASASGILMATSCATSQPPLSTVPSVDLDRFMGEWYVIANIPTLLERGAHNAVESYRLNENGTIATTFTYRKNSFDGPRKEYHPTGFVLDEESNALWGMQFLWPIKADYRVIYLTSDYSQTVIGRNKRDYVWYMARTPRVSEEDYDEVSRIIAESGYDISRLQKVPQRW
jgi:apolipoprotein D and lipocalin family protein